RPPRRGDHGPAGPPPCGARHAVSRALRGIVRSTRWLNGHMTTNSPAATDAAAPTVKIDIWSDVACPWCYVGKRRLETALGRLAESGDGPQVEIEYHSFELAPDTPVDFDGTEVDFLAGHKGMPRAQVEQMLAQMTQLA